MSPEGIKIEDNLEGIAIIGMAGKFPGAADINEFWNNLVKGKCSIESFTDEECLESGVPESILSNPGFVKRGALLKGSNLFDAKFFGYSPYEAKYIDPQQRIFLECAWEALENAGYDSERYDGDIGVYAGSGFNYYLVKNLLSTNPHMESVINPMTFFGNDKDYISTRVSYKMNLTGPSIDIQSACSTSLVAVQLACQALATYQCDMALSGGVSLQTPRMKGYVYAEGEILSKDGYCRPFDKNASGTILAEGVGVVVLKRLEDAVADRDTIYAVIKGIATNNDGSDKLGYTAPSINGQKNVIAMAQALADVDADDVEYIEAHGTGTQLGDPIEIAALTQVFRETTEKRNFCAIGSLKSNIGHLDVAAGVAGLIKTALILKNRKIPGSLFYEDANPEMKIEDSPFYVNDTLSDWESRNKIRYAGVSSFGIGGTNAHAVLSEAPVIDTNISSKPYHILLLSAKSKSALDSSGRRLSEFLKSNPDINLGDAEYTLQTGRRHFKNRKALICSDANKAIEKLESVDEEHSSAGLFNGTAKQVVFMFTGQGAQYPNMAKELYRKLPLFRDEVDKCCEIVKPVLNLDLRELIYPDENQLDSASKLLNETSITQPALFVVEYALARYLMNMGIIPSAATGHSIGEYVAACIAGVFTPEDALKAVAERGRLMGIQEKGDMLAIGLSEKDVLPLLNEYISVSNINSPYQCVVSGPENAIDQLQKNMAEMTTEDGSKVRFTKLKTSHAFHSNMMSPAVEPFKEFIKQFELKAPEIPFISNVTGTWINKDQATDPGYWAHHIRATVRFSDGIHCLTSDSDKIMLEVGPGMVLTSLSRINFPKKSKSVAVSTIRRSDQKESDYACLLGALGRLWTEGIEIDWTNYHADEPRMRIPLPTYPFEREKHWIDWQPSNIKSGKIFTKQTPSEEEIIHKEDESSRDVTGSAKNSNTVEILTDIWKKTLGYRQIEPDENYFELGGSSLMAVSLFERIEHRFGRRLPLATLYEAPTINKLAEILDDWNYEASWDSLVAINKEGSKPPLFFVHAEGGNILEYRPLSVKLGNDQPFYGIQATGLEGEDIVSPSIKEMASEYLREIKTVQPEGPYYIGGYCLGGLVSYEIAQQLIKNGEEVASLILISTSTPDQLRNVKPGITFLHHLIYRLRERIELEMDNMSALNTRMKFHYIFDRVSRSRYRLLIRTEGLLDKIFSAFNLEFKWHSRAYILQTSVDNSNTAFGDYQPKPINIPFHLFRVKKLQWGYELTYDPYLGWKDLASAGVQIYEVDGFHKNILKEPYATPLAEKVMEIVENEKK